MTTKDAMITLYQIYRTILLPTFDTHPCKVLSVSVKRGTNLKKHTKKQYCSTFDWGDERDSAGQLAKYVAEQPTARCNTVVSVASRLIIQVNPRNNRARQ